MVDAIRRPHQFKVEDFHGDDPLVAKTRVFKVQLDDDHDIPASVRQCMPLEFLAIETNGNGACGMHAVFGRPRRGYAEVEMFATHARTLAVQSLQKTLAELEAIGPAGHVQAVCISLWDEFLVPVFRKQGSVEGTTFWKALSQEGGECSELLKEAAQVYEANIKQEATANAAKQRVVAASSSFFSDALEEDFIRPIAVELQYIPANNDVRNSDILGLAQLAHVHPQQSYFLQPADDEHGYIRGTRRIQFPLDGPKSMYDALFDSRPEFDALRQTFLVHEDPESRPERFCATLEQLLRQQQQ